MNKLPPINRVYEIVNWSKLRNEITFLSASLCGIEFSRESGTTELLKDDYCRMVYTSIIKRFALVFKSFPRKTKIKMIGLRPKYGLKIEMLIVEKMIQEPRFLYSLIEIIRYFQKILKSGLKYPNDPFPSTGDERFDKLIKCFIGDIIAFDIDTNELSGMILSVNKLETLAMTTGFLVN